MRDAFQASRAAASVSAEGLAISASDGLVERLGGRKRILVFGERDVGIGRDDRLRIGLRPGRQHEDRSAEQTGCRDRGEPSAAPHHASGSDHHRLLSEKLRATRGKGRSVCEMEAGVRPSRFLARRENAAHSPRFAADRQGKTPKILQSNGFKAQTSKGKLRKAVSDRTFGARKVNGFRRKTQSDQ